MLCYLCDGEMNIIHRGCRDNEKINVCKCSSCGLVSLDSFQHITDEFYAEGNMRTGEVDPDKIETWIQESIVDDTRRFDKLKTRLEGKSVLDFGSGAGGFCKLIKEVAETVYALEPDRETKSIYDSFGVGHYENLSEIPDDLKFDYITAFHVFEHLTDPIATLNELSEYLKDDGVIILEYPNANDSLLTLYECDSFADFTYWSCHTMLFNKKTTKIMIDKSKMNANIIEGIQRYPLSNHLHWLSKNKPGGHKEWSFLNTEEIDKAYHAVLDKQDKCDTIWAELTKKELR